ncbi:phage tail tape measure protein [Thiohalophilus sp.]|uniref:phage tail tape measure protein n=1 Tax=Thiohalophilus sp. TaxID=3028392 RepID=UPI002ACD3EDC|nr:phage tail tape measure protein [Thiohalophilus sp.]MDZ7802356.1 phage tail tape measure protein [Thiohalophilus sp.]
MAKEEIKVSVVFATAGAKRNVKEFTGELKEMEGQTKKTSKNASGSFANMRSSAMRNLGKAGLAGIAVAATGAVVMGFNRMMEKGKEYQNSLADLEAITGITGDQLDELSSNALDLSVKYGEAANNIIEANKLVASQLAEKIDFGTAEGLQQLQEVSEQAVVLQKAAGVDLATSVRTLTTAINQFNLPASETERLINSIAAGSKFGAAEVARSGGCLPVKSVSVAGCG